MLPVRPQVLYALTLVPVGLLADRVDRPRLLAGGIALWSLLTMAASETHSFGQARVCCCQQEQAEATQEGRMAEWLGQHVMFAAVTAAMGCFRLPTLRCSRSPHPTHPPLPLLQLLAMRVGFAAAQATQNPICFSLIPELFPKNRTTAMAVYNTAIYAGRALSFAALILAGHLGVPPPVSRGVCGLGRGRGVGTPGMLLPCPSHPPLLPLVLLSLILPLMLLPTPPWCLSACAWLQAMIGDLGAAYTLVPLDKVDLSLVSVLYTQVGVGAGWGLGGAFQQSCPTAATAASGCSAAKRGCGQHTGLPAVLSPACPLPTTAHCTVRY